MLGYAIVTASLLFIFLVYYIFAVEDSDLETLFVVGLFSIPVIVSLVYIGLTIAGLASGSGSGPFSLGVVSLILIGLEAGVLFVPGLYMIGNDKDEGPAMVLMSIPSINAVVFISMAL